MPYAIHSPVGVIDGQCSFLIQYYRLGLLCLLLIKWIVTVTNNHKEMGPLILKILKRCYEY